MRQCPTRLIGGMFSVMPDTCWVGGLVANTGLHELRSIALIEAGWPLRPVGRPIGARSRLRITGGADCRIEVCRCLLHLDADDRPTWHASRRRGGVRWAAGGAGGAEDSRLIGAVSVSAGVAARLGGDDLVGALQPLIAGGHVWLMLRRADVGPNVISVAVQCEIQWPPGA